MPTMISWSWDKQLVGVDGQGSSYLDTMVAHVCHLVQFQKLKQIFKTRSNNLFTKIMFLENKTKSSMVQFVPIVKCLE